jgi:hypothetical protein
MININCDTVTIASIIGLGTIIIGLLANCIAYWNYKLASQRISEEQVKILKDSYTKVEEIRLKAQTDGIIDVRTMGLLKNIIAEDWYCPDAIRQYIKKLYRYAKEYCDVKNNNDSDEMLPALYAKFVDERPEEIYASYLNKRYWQDQRK